jgi:hypothetical protein
MAVGGMKPSPLLPLLSLLALVSIAVAISVGSSSVALDSVVGTLSTLAGTLARCRRSATTARRRADSADPDAPVLDPVAPRTAYDFVAGAMLGSAQNARVRCAIVTPRHPTGSRSMHSEIEALQSDFIEAPGDEAPGDTPDTASSTAAATQDDVARSEENILRWMEYLPEDCIQTMILMGWDVST